MDSGRRLGTVPLEINVLGFLCRGELEHPKMVDMDGFSQYDINYLIEISPHGLPGMGLVLYVKPRANIDEPECHDNFKQIVNTIHQLHHLVNGSGRGRAFIKNGSVDGFVGTTYGIFRVNAFFPQLQLR